MANCRPSPCKPRKPKCDPEESSCLPKPEGAIVEITPHIFKMIGPKHMKIAVSFVPSLFRFGTAALIAVIYMTDFKTLLQYLPFYNGKYKQEDVPTKKSTKAEKAAEEKKEKADC